jgi:hypothetical protein
MTEQLLPNLENDSSEAYKERVRGRQAAVVARASLDRYHPDNLDLPAAKLYHVQPHEPLLEGDPADAKLASLQAHPNDLDTHINPLLIFDALDTNHNID